MSRHKTAFTFIEIIIAITVFSLIVFAGYSLLSGYSKQSSKGTSMLDSSAVLNEIYNNLQSDMLYSKSFGVHDSNNNLIPAIADNDFDGNTPVPFVDGCRLEITLSDGTKVKYYKEGNALVREEAQKKRIGTERVKKVSFVRVFSGNQTGQKYYELLFSDIELQPETKKFHEQHKVLNMRFFLSPSIL